MLLASLDGSSVGLRGPGPCGRLSNSALVRLFHGFREPKVSRPLRSRACRYPSHQTASGPLASRPVPPADSWPPHIPPHNPCGRETAGATGFPHISRPRHTANPARPTPPERQFPGVYISQGEQRPSRCGRCWSVVIRRSFSL